MAFVAHLLSGTIILTFLVSWRLLRKIESFFSANPLPIALISNNSLPTVLDGYLRNYGAASMGEYNTVI